MAQASAAVTQTGLGSYLGELVVTLDVLLAFSYRVCRNCAILGSKNEQQRFSLLLKSRHGLMMGLQMNCDQSLRTQCLIQCATYKSPRDSSEVNFVLQQKRGDASVHTFASKPEPF